MVVFKLVFILISIFLSVVLSIENSLECKNHVSFWNYNNTFDNVKKLCPNKTCISKCCRSKYIYFWTAHTSYMCKPIVKINNILKQKKIAIGEINYSDIKIYKNDLKSINDVSTKKVNMDIELIKNQKLLKMVRENPYFCKKTHIAQMKDNFILENGQLYKRIPNTYYQFFKMSDVNDYCIDKVIYLKNDEITHGLMVKTVQIPAGRNTWITIRIIQLAISCVFFVLVLIVYLSVKTLRKKLENMVLVNYVTMFLITFVLKLVIICFVTPSICLFVAIPLYFSTISGVCWMNVMSYDIWWKTRDFTTRMTLRQSRKKLFKYGLYAWGVPSLLTIIAATIDNIDLSAHPHIFKPFFKRCLYVDNQFVEVKFYLYLPVGILMVANICFYILAGYNYWEDKNNLMKINKNQALSHKKLLQNYNIKYIFYLKLSVLNGLSWIFEIIELPPTASCILETYNNLLGLTIFILFVGSANIVVQVCDRFSINNPLVEKLRRRRLNCTPQHKKLCKTGTFSETDATNTTCSIETNKIPDVSNSNVIDAKV